MGFHIYFFEIVKIMYGWAFISLKQLKIVGAGDLFH